MTGTELRAFGALDATAPGVELTLHLTELNVCRSSTGAASGTVTMGDGSLVEADMVRIGSGETATGTFNLAGGTLSVRTFSLGAGSFDFTGGALELKTFNKSLTQTGGTRAPRVSPGTPKVAGSWTRDVASKLLVTIASGANDLLTVGGTATLAGTLEVSLGEGYAPNAGDPFASNGGGVGPGALTN